MTSQDLFKTREEEVFFTDNHGIHQYGKGPEGVLIDTQIAELLLPP